MAIRILLLNRTLHWVFITQLGPRPGENSSQSFYYRIELQKQGNEIKLESDKIFYLVALHFPMNASERERNIESESVFN